MRRQDRTGIRRELSSLRVTSAVRLSPDLLAVVQRVFVRRIRGMGRPAPISDEERVRFGYDTTTAACDDAADRMIELPPRID